MAEHAQQQQLNKQNDQSSQQKRKLASDIEEKLLAVVSKVRTLAETQQKEVRTVP
jgi:hypothetical protein